MIYAINIEPNADLPTVLAALEQIGTVTQPGGTERYVHVEADESAHEVLHAIPGVACACDHGLEGRISLLADTASFQTLSADQWALGYISGREDLSSYRYEATGAGVRIYNVDTPADVTISEFGGRATVIHTHPNTVPLAHNHGTTTLSAAGGTANGIAKGALLYNAQGFDGNAANGTVANLNAALDAVANHIESNPSPLRSVVSCSFTVSGQLLGNPFTAVIDRLVALGAIVLAASGNDGTTFGGFLAPNVWPAMDSDVIAVGAHDVNSVRPSWSNQGTQVDIHGPGVSVAVSGISGTPLVYSGTSFSAPFTAGCIACAIEAGITDPKTWLLTNAIDGVLTGKTVGPDGVVYKDPTLAAAVVNPPDPPPPTITVTPDVFDGGNANTLDWSFESDGGNATTKYHPILIAETFL